jgi:hypothetical protein
MQLSEKGGEKSKRCQSGRDSVINFLSLKSKLKGGKKQ